MRSVKALEWSKSLLADVLCLMLQSESLVETAVIGELLHVGMISRASAT